MPWVLILLKDQYEAGKLVEYGHSRPKNLLGGVLGWSVALVLRGGDVDRLRRSDSHSANQLRPCWATELELSDILSEVLQEKDFNLGDRVWSAETILWLQKDPAQVSKSAFLLSVNTVSRGACFGSGYSSDMFHAS